LTTAALPPRPKFFFRPIVSRRYAISHADALSALPSQRLTAATLAKR